MRPEQPAPGERSKGKNKGEFSKKKERKFLSGLKKVGFNVWLAVMVIGGALAFITALFLL